jgi:hypothetical protein
MPKTPEQLRAEVEAQNVGDDDEVVDALSSKTAEGLEVSNPTRGEFFSNLEKASNSQQN